MNSKTSRRDFLKTASAATLAALAAGAPKLWAADKYIPKNAPTADTVIILWMAGGMSHTETFDPKRYAPYEKGMDPKSLPPTCRASHTKVQYIKVSQALDSPPSVMNRGTVIRTSTAADLGFI